LTTTEPEGIVGLRSKVAMTVNNNKGKLQLANNKQQQPKLTST
jgi:hypothetical protein